MYTPREYDSSFSVDNRVVEKHQLVKGSMAAYIPPIVLNEIGCMYRYYTETRGDIFMPRGEAEGQKYINPSFCVIPDIHTTGKVFSYFTVHSSEYSN